MNGLLQAGRLLFGIAMVFFGCQFIIFAASLTGPIPGPPWTHGNVFVAWLLAVGFLVAGLSIVTDKAARWASLLLGAAMLFFASLHYGPALVTRLHDPGPWTVIFELLAMSGGAFVLAANSTPPPDKDLSALVVAGRYLVAVSLVVFAVQHFIYARFVAGLITPWIPGHLFWAYFTGIAFVAAALAIAANKMMRLAASLLGTMFFLWVVVLHIPRVASSPRNGDEVTSLFVALAMSGVGFSLAGASPKSAEVRGI